MIRAVYPRWRGEHNFCSMSLTPIACLSPLARGTRNRNREINCRHRFIPAGAGNTRSPSLTPVTPTVYPRWRGEHVAVDLGLDSGAGLSPLARGTLGFNSRNCGGLRFIPAGAGNTMIRNGYWSAATVYPRWRGEHVITEDFEFAIFGLSPLARGTLRDRAQYRGEERFIPAGAGNTRWPAG